MTNMLRDGLAWLSGKLTDHASREVTYRRGDAAATVQATLGKTVAEQDSGEGLITRMEIRDYLIDTDSLVLDGQHQLPERGDRIEEVDGGQRFVFEVLPIGSDRAWRYSDPFRLKLRIHTRLIATEEI